MGTPLIPDPVAELIRRAGARREPRAELTAGVRATVHGRWRRQVRRDRRRRLAIAAAIAGGLGVAALLAAGRWTATAAPTLSHLERIRGPVWITSGDGRRPAAPGRALVAGDVLETGDDGGAALLERDGRALRLGATSTLRFADEAVHLEAGRLYLETTESSRGDVAPPRPVVTPLGTVHELGTRFAVEVDGAALQVLVRDGTVVVSRGGLEERLDPGDGLRWQAAGEPLRHPVPSWGPAWEWTLDTSPPFRPAGRRLGDFLDWVSRETGWTVAWAEPALAERARDVLYGELELGRPDRAPEVLLPGFGLQARFEDGVLILEEAR